MRSARILQTFLRRFWKEILIFCSIFFIFYINSSYVSYPDEFVNIMGGKFILAGKLPYKEFFDHHMPFGWYLASVLLLVSFKSFVLFRFWWAFFAFFSLLLLAFWIRRESKDIYPYYIGFFLLYPMMAVYFWFHLYVADSLAILFFSMVFWILLAQTIKKDVENSFKPFSTFVVSSILTFLLVFSSLTFIYLALALYTWQIYLVGFKLKRLGMFALWVSAPYFFYLIYLLATGTLKDFYEYNFIYNVTQYISIPNYVKGRYFNPLKFAYTLIYNFYSGYTPTLSKIKNFNIYLPIDTLAVLGSLVILIFLLFRNFAVGMIFFFVLSFSAPRSNLQSINEADYQVGLFLMLGVISAFVSLYLLNQKSDLKKTRAEEYMGRDVKRVAQVILVIFMLFTFIFLGQNTYNKFYLRYTQVMPHIYDLSHTADFIDRVLDKDDYYWVGPYEPHEIFFVKKARLPGKFIHLLPQFSENEKLKSAFIEQFETHPPKIIIYRQEASIFQTPALQFGAFFIDWMKDKYTAVENIPSVSIKQSPSSFNLKTDVYIKNTAKAEVLESLKKERFIE